MVWIRLCMSCIAFLSVAGAVSFGIVRVAQRLRYIENVFLLSALQKISLVLYWTPIPFACVYFSRISGMGGVSSYSGEFVCSTVPGMTVVFQLTGLIWLAGFLVSAARSGIKMCRLAGLIWGNVPVEDSRYLRVFEECRSREGVAGVSLGQNDLLHSPITAGLFRRRIILPFAEYTDTELWMIFEHELTHIRNRDLPWRMFALVTSWVHWFNPVIYMQLRELDCVQEIVCDLSISLDNIHYTKKEYAAFLVKLTGQDGVSIYASALAENKSNTIRRINEMAKTEKPDRLKKWIVGFGCAGLAAFSLIPATAVSAKTAALQEDWIRAEERGGDGAVQ